MRLIHQLPLQLKKQKVLNKDSELRQVKYLNNLIEQDHRFIKKLVKPGRLIQIISEKVRDFLSLEKVGNRTHLGTPKSFKTVAIYTDKKTDLSCIMKSAIAITYSFKPKASVKVTDSRRLPHAC